MSVKKHKSTNRFKQVVMQTQLLCTFTTKEKLQESLQLIRETYHIVYNYIYVLQNKGNLDELFITYNIDTSFKPDRPLDDTILVHRKKESNTLYTINALNTLIKELNGGVLDTSYRINWLDYRNCILLTKGPELKRVNTKLYKIIELEN